MSLKNKNNENYEIDELNIKSHLNTSLELDRISVSEDLINRTLEAIRKQPETESIKTADDLSTKSTSKKVIPWNRYVRGIAGIAAAGLIIFLGYNLLGNFPGSMKKSAETPMYDRAGNTAQAPEAAKEYAATADSSADTTAGDAQDSTAAVQGTDDTKLQMNAAAAEEFTIKADGEAAPAQDSTTAAQDENSGTASGGAYGTEADTGNGTQAYTSAAALSFRDICILTPDQLEKVTITSKEKGTSVTLSDQIAIQSFYTMMDKYTFAPSSEASENQDYTVDFASPEPGTASYTIWIGSNVTVKYTNGEEVSESAYDPTDYATFKQDLDSFFEEYSK